MLMSLGRNHILPHMGIWATYSGLDIPVATMKYWKRLGKKEPAGIKHSKERALIGTKPEKSRGAEKGEGKKIRTSSQR